MNNRSRSLLYFTVLLFALGIGFILYVYNRNEMLIPKDLIGSRGNPVSSSTSPVPTYTPSISKALSPSPVPPLTLGQILAPVFNAPIEFYGRVLDDRDVPLPDVTVEFKPITAYSVGENSTYTERYTTTSDSNGNFMVKNIHGAQLYVQIEKSGYIARDKDGNVKSIGFGEVGGDSVEGGRDPEHPIVFYLKPVLSKEPIIQNYFYVNFKYDKALGHYDVAKITSFGSVESLMTAVYQADSQLITPAHNWSVTLQIPGGGFLPLDDPESQLAPTSGFKETEEIQMSASNKQWDWRADKYYYIKLPGAYFGKVKISVFTSDIREPYFSVSYTLNPKKDSPYLSADSQDSQTPGGN